MVKTPVGRKIHRVPVERDGHFNKKISASRGGASGSRGQGWAGTGGEEYLVAFRWFDGRRSGEAAK